MKKAIYGVIVLIALILGVFSLPTNPSNRDILNGYSSNIRHLLLLLQMYRLDRIDGTQQGMYPSSLDELVKQGYLTNKAYKDLTSDLNIIYKNPSKISDSKTLLLIAHSPKYILYGYSDSTVTTENIKKTEQGAAANP